MPVISIAMATYNGEKYLREQLDSILNQTYSDFELVVCDDCSKDATVAILQEYATKDTRIKIHVNDENLGFKKNFEKAILLCQGEYIALSDQDDVWTENHLEVLIDNLDDCYLVCSNAQLIDSDGQLLGGSVKPDSVYIANKGNEQFLQLLHGNFVQGCTCLFKREIIPFLFPIPSEFVTHDYWFGLVAAVKGGVRYTSEKLVNYRVHQNNSTSPKKTTRWTRIVDFFMESPNYEEKVTLLKKLPRIGLSGEQKIIQSQTLNFFYDIIYKDNAIRKFFYFYKNYNVISSCKSKKLFLVRLIKLFFYRPLRSYNHDQGHCSVF